MSVRVVSLSELKSHDKAGDCWVAIHGRVFDLTRFLPHHPGGGEVIASLAGLDAGSEFEDIGHSDWARLDAKQYFVGILEGAVFESENIPLLAQLRKQTTGLDFRVILGVLALSAAVASFYSLTKK